MKIQVGKDRIPFEFAKQFKRDRLTGIDRLYDRLWLRLDGKTPLVKSNRVRAYFRSRRPGYLRITLTDKVDV